MCSCTAVSSCTHLHGSLSLSRRHFSRQVCLDLLHKFLDKIPTRRISASAAERDRATVSRAPDNRSHLKSG